MKKLTLFEIISLALFTVFSFNHNQPERISEIGNYPVNRAIWQLNRTF